MSTFEVLARYGTAALARFTGLVALFLVLHLVRLPFVVIARVLNAAMRCVDAAVARQVATRPGPFRPAAAGV